MTNDQIQMRKELAGLAKKVLELKKTANPRRPIVIEFCGSPKSGKTSCINALDLFLRRNKFRTRVLTERASVCPIKNKLDPSFNMWTLLSVLTELSEVLANEPKNLDVVIMDRGVFDALTWFSWLKEHSHLDAHSYQTLVEFISMHRWKSAIDLVYVFTATPEVSLAREFADLMTDKPGSIMNQDVLSSYIETATATKTKYKKHFKKVELMDTSDVELKNVNYKVTENILKSLQDATSEKVGYVDRSVLLPEEHSNFNEDEFLKLRGKIKFAPRDMVESDPSMIQPIPILVITNPEYTKVLVVRKNRKSTSDNSPEKQKTLLYVGGHMREEDLADKSDDENLKQLVSHTLAREVQEEINYNYYPTNGEDSKLFPIWVRDGTKSEQHVAICHVIERNVENMKVLLNENEFTRGSSSGIFMEIKSIEESKLESWSKEILKRVFKAQKQVDMNLR